MQKIIIYYIYIYKEQMSSIHTEAPATVAVAISQSRSLVPLATHFSISRHVPDGVRNASRKVNQGGHVLI